METFYSLTVRHTNAEKKYYKKKEKKICCEHCSNTNTNTNTHLHAPRLDFIAREGGKINWMKFPEGNKRQTQLQTSRQSFHFHSVQFIDQIPRKIFLSKLLIYSKATNMGPHNQVICDSYWKWKLKSEQQMKLLNGIHKYPKFKHDLNIFADTNMLLDIILCVWVECMCGAVFINIYA